MGEQTNAQFMTPYHGNDRYACILFIIWDVHPVPGINALNPLNAELNPIRHLLALLGARHIVHVSRVRVKSHPPFASIARSSPYCPR